MSRKFATMFLIKPLLKQFKNLRALVAEIAKITALTQILINEKISTIKNKKIG